MNANSVSRIPTCDNEPGWYAKYVRKEKESEALLRDNMVDLYLTKYIRASLVFIHNIIKCKQHSCLKPTNVTTGYLPSLSLKRV